MYKNKLSLLHAPDEVPVSSVEEIWELASQPAFVAYAACVFVTVLVLVVRYAPPLIPGSIVDGWNSVGDGVHSGAAALVIVVPTLLNCAKWYQRSQEGAEFVGDI